MRRFHHLGEEWEAEPTGTGHGVGSGHVPAITSWGVMFRRVSKPDKGPYFGSISRPDVTQASEEDLRKSLEDAITRAIFKALEDPQWDWRTVDGLAEDTGLPSDHIRTALESSSDDVIRSRAPDSEGRVLYTTRRHYTKRRGFFDHLRST